MACSLVQLGSAIEVVGLQNHHMIFNCRKYEISVTYFQEVVEIPTGVVGAHTVVATF